MGLDRAIDITVGQRKTVLALLERHLPNTAAWVYGSRAKWTSRPQSDLDLVVFATPEQNGRVSDLREAFEESDLPFRVDLFVWDTVPEKFRKQIKRDHVALRPVETPNERGQGISGQWQEVRWGDLATLEYGRALRGHDTARGPFRVFGTNGPIGWHDEALCPRPSVVVGRKGAYRGIHYSAEPFFVIDTAFYLKPKTELDIRWAYYELLTRDINGMDSGSAIPSTNREEFYGLPVTVPSIPEQRAIAHILGTLDDKIELNRRMNETLEAMARALFKSWFVDFDPVRAKMEGRDPCLPEHLADLFPDRMEDSELGEIPKGWEAKALGECVNLTMGQSPPGSTYNEQGEGLPFFQGRSDFGFRYPENRKFCTAPTRIADPEDTLVSVRAPVGDINMAWERCCIGRGVAALRHKSDTMSFSYYSTWTIQSVLQEYEHTGTVFGAVNKSQFEALRVIEPNPNIVEAFDSCARPLDTRIRSNIAESRALAALRDALLPKLISGDLRVKSTEAFLERVL